VHHEKSKKVARKMTFVWENDGNNAEKGRDVNAE
jgi:hypothetical protein